HRKRADFRTADLADVQLIPPLHGDSVEALGVLLELRTEVGVRNADQLADALADRLPAQPGDSLLRDDEVDEAAMDGLNRTLGVPTQDPRVPRPIHQLR